jgi:hypothetical protein
VNLEGEPSPDLLAAIKNGPHVLDVHVVAMNQPQA